MNLDPNKTVFQRLLRAVQAAIPEGMTDREHMRIATELHPYVVAERKDAAEGDVLMKRTKPKPGPWVPVDQPASTPGVETRTPNRPEGPKLAEAHPDAYPDYATDRPNGGRDE